MAREAVVAAVPARSPEPRGAPRSASLVNDRPTEMLDGTRRVSPVKGPCSPGVSATLPGRPSSVAGRGGVVGGRPGVVARWTLGVCLAASLIACPSSTPQAIKNGGTLVSTRSLERTRLLAGTARIFELRWLGDELLTVTSRGALRLDRSGRSLDTTALVPEAIRSPVASGEAAGVSEPAFVAHVPEEEALVLYDQDGRQSASVPVDFKYAQRLQIADVTADDAGEVVVAPSGAKHIEIYDARGELLRSPRSPFYVTSVETFDFDENGKEEIVVSVYPDSSGKSTFYFLDGSGELLREWGYEIVSDFDVSRTDEGPVLVTEQDGSYRILSPEGHELERLRAPLAEYFADLVARPWRGGWVIVASGSGYRPYHMVSVFDASGELVYQETEEGWSRDLEIPDAQGTEFFVAVGSHLYRYELPGE